MTHETASGPVIEVQNVSTAADVPEDAALETWGRSALENDQSDIELVIRIVDEAESRALNLQYRGHDKATNVLSFPFEQPPGLEINHLGDLVICAAVVAREALEQGKPLEHHWAHMVVHGILHLRGYDHQNEQQAKVMEALEKQLLKELGIADPYRVRGVAV